MLTPKEKFVSYFSVLRCCDAKKIVVSPALNLNLQIYMYSLYITTLIAVLTEGVTGETENKSTGLWCMKNLLMWTGQPSSMYGII